MTGGSLGQRNGSYGSLANLNGVIAGPGGLLHSKSFGSVRKSSTKMLSGSREKERSLPFLWCRYLGRRKVSMLLLVAFALLVFVLGSFVVNKESTSPNVDQRTGTLGLVPFVNGAHNTPEASSILGRKDLQKDEHYSEANSLKGDDGDRFPIPASRGNYDIIQQPINISEEAKKNIPFYMFIDEETEAYMKNKSVLDSSKRVGLWRIVVIHNVPYSDARRNGKVPKLLLHRIFPNVRYSIWIDGKLQLVVDPYQVLERFLWRQNASFAISRHYRRFDVFVEAEANKAAGKYDNSSIDEQAYHRDLLEHMPPPVATMTQLPQALPVISTRGKTPGRRIPRHGRDRKSGSRRHRKAAAGNRDNNSFRMLFEPIEK
ncbi:hypothetical protein COLO4_27170 [Corchorus olitorius]|uniref:TOD1/MUCI70 glycosyltransferase-like domain-containing protein n=1 Tax=Corchorus olitorius TaxID=93759 RepID=A0A1R3HSH2_9ROSI|nr:hypothetical protein COLO4_27170 [Corchorus olitorius]